MKLPTTLLALSVIMAFSSHASEKYNISKPMEDGTQAEFRTLSYKDGKMRVAYMPPATEFNYYMAIGEGIKSLASESDNIETFMLAPQSGADINGQMGMLQDVIGQGVNAIIISTHDEHAAAPLIRRAVEQGIAIITVNSDITTFPTPIHGVVGFSQWQGTEKIARYAIDKYQSKAANVGLITGQPGYHDDQRMGGFKSGIEGANFSVVSQVNGKWNVEGGNTAAMDMLQAHPEIDVIFASNDYMAMGATLAAKALGKRDLTILGNDGDTAALEEIYKGNIDATVNTLPFKMGRVALQVAMDSLTGDFKGGWVETPTSVATQSLAGEILKHPELLYPKPSKDY